MPSSRPRFLFLATLISALPVVIVLRNLLLQINSWPMTDLTTHAAKLYFFETVGYGGITQQWNFGVGYTLFATYPPGYFFLAFPLENIFSLVGATNVILPAMILSAFILLFFLVFLTSRFLTKSLAHAFLLVFLVFFNPLTINWIFETGRLPELTGWVVFIPILGTIIHALHQTLSAKKMLALGILFSLLMVSHPAVYTMALIAWGIFSLLTFSKNGFKTVIPIAIGLVGSAWWTMPYFTAKKDLLLSSYVGFHLEASYIFTNFFHVIAVALLLIITYFACREKHPLLKWWAAVAGVGILTLLGVPRWIPFFNQPHQVTYAVFLLLVGVHGVITLDWSRISVSFPWIKYFKIIVLFLLVVMSAYSTIKFFDFAEKRDIHSLYENEIDDLALRLKEPFTCYPECGGELSYWAIQYGRSTTDNFSPEATPLTIAQYKSELNQGIISQNCPIISEALQKLKVNTLVAHHEFCPMLNACGFSTEETPHWCVAVNK